MNPLAQWAPAIFMVFAIWIGLIYNNKRLDDFKDLLKSEIRGSGERTLRAMAELRAALGKDIADLSYRVSRLEEQRGLVRP